MALNVYYRRDIANVLRAAAVANTDTGERRDAFIRALVVVGLAVGLEPSRESVRRQLETGQQALEWKEAR